MNVFSNPAHALS